MWATVGVLSVFGNGKLSYSSEDGQFCCSPNRTRRKAPDLLHSSCTAPLLGVPLLMSTRGMGMVRAPDVFSSALRSIARKYGYLVHLQDKNPLPSVATSQSAGSRQTIWRKTQLSTAVSHAAHDKALAVSEASFELRVKVATLVQLRLSRMCTFSYEMSSEISR